MQTGKSISSAARPFRFISLGSLGHSMSPRLAACSDRDVLVLEPRGSPRYTRLTSLVRRSAGPALEIGLSSDRCRHVLRGTGCLNNAEATALSLRRRSAPFPKLSELRLIDVLSLSVPETSAAEIPRPANRLKNETHPLAPLPCKWRRLWVPRSRRLRARG